MSALTRIPCPQCGAPNLPHDPVCLTCGRTLSLPAKPAPLPAAPVFEGDQTCPRCHRVLVNASEVTAAQAMGGLDSGVGLMTWNRTFLLVNALIWMADMVKTLIAGGVQQKQRGRSLESALRQDPNALYCASCGTIVKSSAR